MHSRLERFLRNLAWYVESHSLLRELKLSSLYRWANCGESSTPIYGAMCDSSPAIFPLAVGRSEDGRAQAFCPNLRLERLDVVVAAGFGARGQCRRHLPFWRRPPTRGCFGCSAEALN
jgi:hypothetical protein